MPVARAVADGVAGAAFVEIPPSQGHLAARSTRPEDAAFLDGAIAALLQAKG